MFNGNRQSLRIDADSDTRRHSQLVFEMLEEQGVPNEIHCILDKPDG